MLTEQELALWLHIADEPINFARAIESALLEKLKAQEPDKWTPAGFCDDGEPLYRHPLPPDDVVRDVERYRWLRDNHNHWSWNPSQYNKDIVSGFSCKDIGYAGYCLQDAIDTAMEKMK